MSMFLLAMSRHHVSKEIVSRCMLHAPQNNCLAVVLSSQENGLKRARRERERKRKATAKSYQSMDTFVRELPRKETESAMSEDSQFIRKTEFLHIKIFKVNLKVQRF